MTKRALLIVVLLLFAGLAPAQGNPAAERTVMYATFWCPYCAQARAYFARKGIPYTEQDVEKSAEARAEFRRLGGKAVPLFVHNGELVRGFNEAAFEALLDRSPAR
jgi:mycoredoxin